MTLKEVFQSRRMMRWSDDAGFVTETSERQRTPPGIAKFLLEAMQGSVCFVIEPT